MDNLSNIFVARSTAIAWTLFALSCHPTVQTTLRAELSTCPTDMPTMDQLNALPYLEGVVREVLRLYAPVSATQRIVMHDAEIPLQKPFKDNRGIMQSSIRCVMTNAKFADSLNNKNQMTRQGVQGGFYCCPYSPAEPLDGDMGRRC